MYIQQIYTDCLSEASYYIESGGQAVIIDPVRDIEQYLKLAAERKAAIKYIFETHFHADFVSGHIDLSTATGAPIVFGPLARPKYKAYIAKDGEEFTIGGIRFEVLHTPGHTVESACYLLKDKNGSPVALFSGDTVFVGDVGRPDLSSGNSTSSELASMLFDSLNNKIKNLPDEVIVYPAHGPGSSCGKNIGKETSSTIGKEKAANYAFLAESREEFIKAVINELPPAPVYFSGTAAINMQGYENLEKIYKKALQPLTVEELAGKSDHKDTLIVDTRHADEFTEGYIPSSISIGLEGRFAEWAATILPFDKEIVLITETGKEKESVTRLARVGFSKFGGYLKGGFDTWKNAGKPIDIIISIEPDEMRMDMNFDEKMLVLDVRKPEEYQKGHISHAVNLPLNNLTDTGTISTIDDEDNVYIHCAGGYRSVIAASLIKRQGFHNIRNVKGGWNKLKVELGIS